MATKARNSRVKQTRGRSPSLPRKVEIGQPSLPSILERIKSLTSTDSGKVPIYCKHTVCSILYARDRIKQPSFDKAEPPRRSLDKLVPHSKTVSTKSRSTGSTKSKEVGKTLLPLKSKNVVNVLEKHVYDKNQTRQTSKGLESKTMIVEKKPRISNEILTHKDDDKSNIIPIVNNDIPILEYDNIRRHMEDETRDLLDYEDGEKNAPFEPPDIQDRLDQPDTCSQENLAIYETIDIKHLDDHDCEISYQDDQVDETFDDGNDHVSCSRVDEEKESEQAVIEEDLGSKDAENIESNDLEHEERKPIDLEYEEPKPKRPGINEGGEEVPKKEDTTSKVVSQNQQVVAYGKKDTATCNRVIDETLSTLREQRRNRVKALVGTFENVISH